MPYYTGVGSRQTPVDVVKRLILIGFKLAQAGFILRSGGAQGADSAFEEGCDAAGGAKEIWLPWNGYDRRYEKRYLPSPKAYELAATLHPAWDRLTPGARSLHARNTHQILGEDLNTPSDFTVCWTPDGAEKEGRLSAKTGGTSTAIRLSLRKDVPVFNIRNSASYDRFKAFLTDRYPTAFTQKEKK